MFLYKYKINLKCKTSSVIVNTFLLNYHQLEICSLLTTPGETYSITSSVSQAFLSDVDKHFRGN